VLSHSVQTLTKQLLIQDGNTLVLRPMVLNCYAMVLQSINMIQGQNKNERLFLLCELQLYFEERLM